jgi:hypothetical protein
MGRAASGDRALPHPGVFVQTAYFGHAILTFGQFL